MGTILSCPRYLDEGSEVQRELWLRASLVKDGLGFLTHALSPVTGWALRIHRAVNYWARTMAGRCGLGLTGSRRGGCV